MAKKIVLFIPSMVCASCTTGIASILERHHLKHKIDLIDQTVTVTVHNEDELSHCEHNLLTALADIGHDTVFSGEDIAHARNLKFSAHDHQRKAKICLLICIPLMIIGFFGIIPLPLIFTGQLIGFAIGIVTLGTMIYCGKDFYYGAWRAFKAKTSTMETLISLGITGAWLYSMCIVLFPAAFPVAALHLYFSTALLILGLVNLGKSWQTQAKYAVAKERRNIISEIEKLQPRFVLRKKDDTIEEIPTETIERGDILIVNPHTRIPVEGKIIRPIDKDVLLDVSHLWGKKVFIKHNFAHELMSGSLNKTGPITMRATCTMGESKMHQLIQSIKAHLSHEKPPQFVNRIMHYFVPIVILIAGLTAAAWAIFAASYGLPYLISATLSVLLCACPCVIGLASPLTYAITLNESLKSGLLVGDIATLLDCNRVKTVFFDKTGTLTEGKPSIAHYHFDKNTTHTDKQLWAMLKALEDHSAHPISQAFKNIEPSICPLPDNINIEARGMCGNFDTTTLHIGDQNYFENKHFSISPFYRELAIEYATQGAEPIYIGHDNQITGIIGVKDELKPDAKAVIKALQQRNIEVHMLTGGNPTHSQFIATQLGIPKTRVYAEYDMAMKDQLISDWPREHGLVAVIGDNINDSKALANADVGFALGAWGNLGAAITLRSNSLYGIINAFDIASASERTVKQNLFWSLFYNAFSILISTGILYPFIGLMLTPPIAASMMVLSSIVLIYNSNRLSNQINTIGNPSKGDIPQTHKTVQQQLATPINISNKERTLSALLPQAKQQSDANLFKKERQLQNNTVPDGVFARSSVLTPDTRMINTVK